jgi:tetratricopeptide (TPR) repeat protein
MGLNSSLGETAVPLADALHAQGRFEEADSVLKAIKDEWVTGDPGVGASRLAVRAKLLAAEGWTRLAEETAERALRIVRRTDWLCLQADALLAYADVLLLGGREQEALDRAREAAEIAEAKGYAVAARRATDLAEAHTTAQAKRREG